MQTTPDEADSAHSIPEEQTQASSRGNPGDRLTEQPLAKRPRHSDPNHPTSGTIHHVQPPETHVSVEQRETYSPALRDACVKLCKYLKSDSKFSKATELMVQLLSQQMDSDSICAIWETLNDVFTMRESDSISNPIICNGLRCIIETAYTKSIQLDLSNIYVKYQIDTCYIVYALQSKIVTDDSFEFSTCATLLHTMLVASIPSLPGFPLANVTDELEGQREGLIAKRMQAVITCLKICLKKYTLQAWSKQPIEKLMTTASEYRLAFSSDIRDKVDELTNAFTIVKRKQVSYTGPTHVRTYNSVAHPLRTTRNDVFK